MKELRFDFSAPALPEPATRGTSDWPCAYDHRPSGTETSIPPATRLAFLIVIGLIALLFSYVLSSVTRTASVLGAAEEILPAPPASPKLKTAAETHALALIETPPPLASEERGAGPRENLTRDSDMSPVVELLLASPSPLAPLPHGEKGRGEGQATFVPEPPPQAEVKQEAAQVYLESQPGDSPMLQNWKTLKFAAALAAALAAGQVALAQEQTGAKTILDRLEEMDGEIKKSFQNLQMDMKSLQGNVLEHRAEIDSLKTKVSDLEGNIKQVRDQLEELRRKLPGEIALFTPVTKEDFEELRKRLSNIEQKLNQTPSSDRVALSPSSSTGRIMLVNLYNEDLIFILNDQTYRVPAGRTVPVDNVPAGNVAYEMISPTWGRRANTTTRLAANETLTLTVQ